MRFKNGTRISLFLTRFWTDLSYVLSSDQLSLWYLRQLESA
jgi:hypothetical protein